MITDSEIGSEDAGIVHFISFSVDAFVDGVFDAARGLVLLVLLRRLALALHFPSHRLVECLLNLLSWELTFVPQNFLGMVSSRLAPPFVLGLSYFEAEIS
jgi:hypothetical protein